MLIKGVDNELVNRIPHEIKGNDQINLGENESVSEILQIISSKFPHILENDSRDYIQRHEAEIHIKECKPIFHKAYSVPLRLREKLSAELDRLVVEEIISPVKHSDWASPIVVVPKPNGEIRMCVDCGVTINPFLKTVHYPMPNIEEIFASPANCNVFCCLDLSGAYQQLKVSEASKKLLTINTHKGLFQFNRLPFGIASAPSIFQKVMDQILLSVKNFLLFG